LRGSTHPVIDWLAKNVNWNDEKNTIIFLGDNVYPLGLPLEGDPSYPRSKQILDYQLNLIKGKKAKAFFIPGNHDWRNGKLGGWEQVMNEQDYINSLEQKNIQAWPLNGCPGPVPIELTDKIVLALMDSQWFLFLHDKPGPGSNCDAKTIDEFQTQLEEIAAAHPNQLLVVALHHAIVSYGVHGGDYTWKEHIFPFTAINPKLYIPLPILGSVYPLTRGVFGNVQDLKHPLYKGMAKVIEEVVKKHPYPVVVAGHDHSLQMIVKDSIPYIVSGAGVNSSRAQDGRDKLFSDVSLGFSTIEVWKSGKVEVKFYNTQSASMDRPTFTTALKSIVPVTRQATIDTTRPIFDSVAVLAANPRLEGNGIRNFLIGKNYRKEWTQPIRIKVLDLNKEMGGLKPTKQGGGKQTKSLRIVDSTGKEWALRSVVKNPEAAIPADLRQTVVKDVVQDGISASYPYGALSMETFSKAAGIPYLRNRLVYLPDDPRLDRFRADFKNMMAFMEEREPFGVKKTDNTDEVVLRLVKDNDDHVDQKAVLRARLLDNFVMDFDRHEGQWLWATKDTGKGKLYYPIPKDRDQVFYVNQGLIPFLIRRPWAVPELQGFRAKAINIKTFNRAARNFDRTFLTSLTRDDWNRQVDTFLTAMTDDVIETALMQQPPEIQKYSTDKIAKTLKARKKHFAHEMDQYYRFLSRTVTVVGSNKREQVVIDKNEDGTMRVQVNKITKQNVVTGKMYDRVFDPNVTKEVRIFGLNDDDRFVVNGGNNKIKVRIVGGSGNDTFVNNGSGKKILAYDASFEKNIFQGKTGGFRKTVIPDPQVNRYDRLNFKYNYINPGVAFEYNIDDGIFLGGRMVYINQGFRKEPYNMRHFFQASRALRTGSVHFIYNADFIKAFRNNDILIRSDIKAPVNVTNFFGIGNSTVPDRTLVTKTNFYRARYNITNVSVYLRRQLQSWMRINFGPTYQSFNLDSAQNVGRYVSTPGALPADGSIYSKKSFIGGDLRLDINSKNNDVLPTRGLVLDMGARSLFGTNSLSHNIVQVNTDMRIFMNLFSYPRIVFALRLGWGANYGRYEFPQAMYLGGTDNLRGYRKQRFAGKSMFFNNAELRIRIADFNTYLFPGSVGLLLFNDVGRVWARGEHSQTWHDGYGFGVWLAPIRRFVVTASLAHSREEDLLPRITFGFHF
ncbi:MAG TPA: BamA/TamA family outer membrane protein, partial [Flavisolibacter sp.]|nr:BamA/TamA family outer membrane protein [Flavisolibacter sp.]